MRRLPVLFASLLCVLCFTGLAVESEARENQRSWTQVQKDFRAALRGKTPEARATAFEFLRDRAEPAAVTELLKGFKAFQKNAKKVRDEQTKAVAQLGKLQGQLEAIKQKFEESSHSVRDIEAYNKATRKNDNNRQRLFRLRKLLESEWLAYRALFDGGTDVGASILRAMEEGDLHVALGQFATNWRDLAPSTEGPQRWVETLVDVMRKPVSEAFRDSLNKADLPLSTRVAALQALGMRGDGAVIGVATDLLKASPEKFPLVTAAIGVLKRLHDRRAIVPLIFFLGRQDIARLREDGRAALVSLTGQKHGPYQEPWQSWWQEYGKKFVMPPAPVELPSVRPQGEGVTFYGIHTFSDKVLFILDISGSMEWALGGPKNEPGGDKAKIITARKELVGAVYNLPQKAVFNVILFNHAVIPWNPKVVEATNTNRKKLENFVKSSEPTGLTNIHDALHAGFMMALRSYERPEVDTIFFLTDGTPTSGRVTDPKAILDMARVMNHMGQLKIHVIGIGGDKDIDEEFLKELAKIGQGEYVRHGG